MPGTARGSTLKPLFDPKSRRTQSLFLMNVYGCPLLRSLACDGARAQMLTIRYLKAGSRHAGWNKASEFINTDKDFLNEGPQYILLKVNPSNGNALPLFG